MNNKDTNPETASPQENPAHALSHGKDAGLFTLCGLPSEEVAISNRPDCLVCKSVYQTPDQNPPVDPAALAAAAETKVLPRVEIPEGYRILEVGEKIHTGDKFVGIRLEFSQGFDTHCAGETVPNHTDGLYFRRIDPAPAALAETKVLPRFPGYREMGVKEVIVDGDMRAGRRDSTLHPAPYMGHEVGWSGRGLYFRPIEPVPHTEGRNKSNHIPCTYCRGLGFIPSSMDIRQPTCPHCCGTKDEPEPHRAPFAPQVSDGFEREIKSIAGVSLG